MDDIQKRIEAVLSHIGNVQRNCYKLGFQLIKIGEKQIGLGLIHNGQIHDNSKLTGIELEHLWKGDNLLHEAITHHQSTNQHHPEYWGKIQDMPKVFLAEMVCDCAARAAEFGTDVRQYLFGVATKKYSFEKDDEVGRAMQQFLSLLLEEPFQ